MKYDIHFVHGNGFPSLCYKQFLDGLSLNYYYLDKVGHNPNYPVTDNWDYLVDEVIHSIESQVDKPVYGVGHSLGGVLTFLASMRRPDLFNKIILLDSPLLGHLHSWIIFLSKRFGFIDNITPASQIKKRCIVWSTREKAMAYLKRKPLFKHFTLECLNDYIDYGMEKSDSGYYLRFDRDIEYQIYRTLPHALPRFKKAVKVPMYLIYGSHSHLVNQNIVKYMLKHYCLNAKVIEGTHMFPMEQPQLCADMVREIIEFEARA